MVTVLYHVDLPSGLSDQQYRDTKAIALEHGGRYAAALAAHPARGIPKVAAGFIFLDQDKADAFAKAIG